MAQKTEVSGWLPDPTGRHRLRYWDGDEWTAWVADSETATLDADRAIVAAKPVAGRKGRRGALVVGIAAAVFAAFFVIGLIAWSQVGNEEGRNAQQSIEKYEAEAIIEQNLRNEIDGWSLPDTVIRSPGGAFNLDLGDTVTRSFAAQGGADTRRAAEDLVAALHEQGYQDLAITSDGEWAGQCHARSTCRISIWVDDTDDLIVVELRA